MADGRPSWPVFTFTTPGDVPFDLFDVPRRLHERGRQVPAGGFPADRTDPAVLRAAGRKGFSRDLAYRCSPG
ncbi:hypothetical protein ACFXKJ_27665 [Kitasatospora indigofera]|uniref:hypothetical protein n=1 Tax=Kitasatospora indigofera TaxID=67307 RepID=UPI00365B7118